MDQIIQQGELPPVGPLPPPTEVGERVVGPGAPQSSEEQRTQKRHLLYKKHYRKSRIERQLDEKLRAICPNGKLGTVVGNVLDDPLIASIQNYANVVSIQRMGYNDHGPVHARIVAQNAMTICDLLEAGGVHPSTVMEEVATREDARIAVFLGAFLHDLGMSVTRDNHEWHSVHIADRFLDQHLSKVYDDEGRIWMMKSLVNECIIGHMAHYRISSVEAGIVMLADGADCTKGRAQIPILLNKNAMLGDIHRFSATAIEKVRIIAGRRKPVRIEIEMVSSAGLFQVEEVLMGKAKLSPIMNYLEIAAYLDGKERLYLQ